MYKLIGFIAMGGLVVVSAAVSLIIWRVKKAYKDTLLIRGFMNATGCSFKIACAAKDTLRDYEAMYAKEGTLNREVYEALINHALRFCKENAGV